MALSGLRGGLGVGGGDAGAKSRALAVGGIAHRAEFSGEVNGDCALWHRF